MSVSVNFHGALAVRADANRGSTGEGSVFWVELRMGKGQMATVFLPSWEYAQRLALAINGAAPHPTTDRLVGYVDERARSTTAQIAEMIDQQPSVAPAFKAGVRAATEDTVPHG